MSLYVLKKSSDIILLGDIMLDHNIEGTCTKIANESPIPVINSNREYYNLGGCGNVLMNLLALGADNVFLFSRIGIDKNGEKLISLLPTKTINNLIRDSEFITITKNRVYSEHKLLCRYDNEIIKYTMVEEEDIILENIKNILNSKTIGSVVFSDYNKGFLTESLCQKVITLCNSYNICTIVDPKNNYKKYLNCTVIKPNKYETNNIFKINIDKVDILEAHKQIKYLVKCDTSVITLSGEGITSYKNNVLYKYKEESEEIIDVTGAGDIVCSVFGVLYSQIDDIDIIIKIANHLATISIAHLGVYVISDRDILDTYRHIHKTKVINLQCFPKINKKIVFTNGCFDLIHSAHIELFKFCRSLGDSVIVGLNSDESIKRLKGESRPIYKLEDRIKILEAIEYIDYIIPFEDDTPIKLIEYIKPNILVKGGDYTKDNIIGKEYAQEIILFNYIDGKSTTNTIKVIKNN
jgi:D-beta-D-heptose 7-phosphate kinase/D-beta-D-heptose 1-phosphate adenosyltransferase